MKYFSTNDKSIKVSFREAVLNGIPLDKGLYFPEKIPTLNKDFFERIQLCLNQNSCIFLSTDWKNYAEQIKDVLRDFEEKFSIETIKQIPGRQLSKFQKKGK